MVPISHVIPHRHDHGPSDPDNNPLAETLPESKNMGGEWGEKEYKTGIFWEEKVAAGKSRRAWYKKKRSRELSNQACL